MPPPRWRLKAPTLEGILNLLHGGLRLVPKQRVHAHNNAGRAEPALGAVAFGDSLLKWTEDIDPHAGRCSLRLSG